MSDKDSASNYIQLVSYSLSKFTYDERIIKSLESFFVNHIFKKELGIEYTQFFEYFNKKYVQYYSLVLTFRTVLYDCIFFFIPYIIITLVCYFNTIIFDFLFFLPEIILISLTTLIFITYAVFRIDFKKFFLKELFTKKFQSMQNELENNQSSLKVVSSETVENLIHDKLGIVVEKFQEYQISFRKFFDKIRDIIEDTAENSVRNTFKDILIHGLLSNFFNKYKIIYFMVIGISISLFNYYIRIPGITVNPIIICACVLLMVPFFLQIFNFGHILFKFRQEEVVIKEPIITLYKAIFNKKP